MTVAYVQAIERASETFSHSLDQDPLLGSVIRGDVGRADYVRFLWASYHYVHYSGFLLAKTAEGLRRSGRCSLLHSLVAQKSEEEGPHDGWLLRDLKNCGVNPELVKGSTAPTAVRAYVEWSLVFAEAGSPAFLGAAYALEFISMRRAKAAATNLRARSSIKNIDRAVLFLEGHGDADQGHIAELEAALGTVTNEQDQAEIAFSASVVRNLYLRFFAVAS